MDQCKHGGHDTATYSFHDPNINTPWSLGQPDNDDIIDGIRVETRLPNMQLLDPQY
jgi:hypothetical protein